MRGGTQPRLHCHLGADPFVSHDNILAGTAYLRELYDRFGAAGFFAAYNAGSELFQDYVSCLRLLHDETEFYFTKLGSLLPDVPIGRAVSVPWLGRETGNVRYLLPAAVLRG
ncbi:MAG: lytic transglycosylase domain-containing protein [Rhizomicrobium sp.]